MIMDNDKIRHIAMCQSAEDLGCKAEDFLSSENKVVPFKLGPGARKYLKEPIICNFVSYGGNVVAGAQPEVMDLVKEYVNKYPYYHLFETPNMHWLNERLEQLDSRVCFMAEYYLPDLDKLQRNPCKYETRLLGPKDFQDLYKEEWSNALCEYRKELDVLAIGAYDQGKLIALAGCSMDCEDMWQIGIDVLPEYRRQGVAKALTSNLAMEILDRGKVPFYCSAWSNLPSVRNAIASGFVPAWVEMTAKPKSVVESMNC